MHMRTGFQLVKKKEQSFPTVKVVNIKIDVTFSSINVECQASLLCIGVCMNDMLAKSYTTTFHLGRHNGTKPNDVLCMRRCSQDVIKYPQIKNIGLYGTFCLPIEMELFEEATVSTEICPLWGECTVFSVHQP